jgi:hypothetical protein
MNFRSPGATKLLGALALVLVTGLGWLFVLGPATSALTDVRAETASVRAQNETLRQQLALLEKQEQNLPRTRADAQALAAKFPATADQPGLFQAVTEAAASAGIPARDLTALTPTPPVVGTGDDAEAVQLPSEVAARDLATQTVTVSVEATYDETRRLLANLEHMPRAFLISSLTVAAGADTGLFSTTISGDMFVMPPADDPGPDAAGSPEGGY